jgi:hypothetical protein
MKNGMESRGTEDSRRGFFQRCLGTAAVLAAAPPGHAGASGVLGHLHLLGGPTPGLEEYERIMGRTDLMDVVGRPRSWSVVSRGFHPFSPERIVVLRSGSEHPWRGGGYGVRCGRPARRRIDAQIDVEIDEPIQLTRRINPGYEPEGGWFPDSKRESIYWIMDVMADHYGDCSRFEPWVVVLAGRELLGAEAFQGCGMAHQFQHDGGDVPVEWPAVDWWLFLMPEGLNWASIYHEPVHALLGHVGRCAWAKRPSLMLPVWCLSSSIARRVPDARLVSRMSRVAAAHHLNKIAAECLEGMDSPSRS